MEPQLASVTSSLLVPPAGCMRTVSSPACQDRGSSPALPDSSQSYPFAGPRLSRPWAYPLQSAQPAVAGPTVFRARSDGELLAEVSAGVSSDRDSEAGPPGDSPRRPGSRSDSAEALDDEETGPGRPKSLEAGESDEDSREARGAVYENGSACRLVHSGREDLAIDGVGEIRAEMLFNGLPTVLEESSRIPGDAVSFSCSSGSCKSAHWYAFIQEFHVESISFSQRDRTQKDALRNKVSARLVMICYHSQTLRQHRQDIR